MAESHREEIAKLEALYASNPGGRVFVHLAEAYRKAGELELARGIVTEGLARHTDSASGYVVLGRVLGDLGEPSAAESAFRRVLELDAGNLIALRGLGDLALEAGRVDDALDAYRDLLARNPSNEEVRELVGRVERGELAGGAATPPEAEASEAAEELAAGGAQAAAEPVPTAEAPTGDLPDAAAPPPFEGMGVQKSAFWGAAPAAGEADLAGQGPTLGGASVPSDDAAAGVEAEAAPHESAEEPARPIGGEEPLSGPISPYSAAPGETGDTTPAPPFVALADASALPGDLASFTGLEAERTAAPEPADAADAEEAVALSADDRDLDLQDLMDSAVDAGPSLGAADATMEPLEIEAFDAGDVTELPALELRVEHDGAAIEPEDGGTGTAAPEFVSGFGEPESHPAEEAAATGDEPGEPAPEAAAFSPEAFPDLMLAPADAPVDQHAGATTPEAPIADAGMQAGEGVGDIGDFGEAGEGIGLDAGEAAVDPGAFAFWTDDAGADVDEPDAATEADDTSGEGFPFEFAGEVGEAVSWDEQGETDETDEVAAWGPAADVEVGAGETGEVPDRHSAADVEAEAEETAGMADNVAGSPADGLEAEDAATSAGDAGAGPLDVGHDVPWSVGAAVGDAVDEAVAGDAGIGDMDLVPEDLVPEDLAPEELVPEELDAGGFGAAVGGPVPEARSVEAPVPEAGERRLETETMADLYRSQGFYDRAADVYRALLGRRPGDERLAAKLAEVESQAAAGRLPSLVEEDEAGEVWLKASSWADEGERAGGSPYVWAEPSLAAAEPDDDGAPIGTYLEGLAAWVPGSAAAAGASELDAGAPLADAELRVPPMLELDPLTAGEATGAAPGPAAALELAEPAGAQAEESGTGAEAPDVATPAAPGEPAEAGGRRGAVEAAFDEWYGPGEAARKAQPPAEESSEDDEDLAMFRSWLQSLKK